MLLIAKGLITKDEFMQKLSDENEAVQIFLDSYFSHRCFRPGRLHAFGYPERRGSRWASEWEGRLLSDSSLVDRCF